MGVEGCRRAAMAALILCGASTGAAAWQRPAAQPSRNVEACPEMGEGFVRVPGSDTCVRMSGSVRVEALHNGGGASFFPAGR